MACHGSYNFGDDVPAGDWELQVEADGYETAEIPFGLAENDTETVDVTLEAQ